MKVGQTIRITTPMGEYVIYREKDWYRKRQYTYYKVGDNRGERKHVSHERIKKILKYA